MSKRKANDLASRFIDREAEEADSDSDEDAPNSKRARVGEGQDILPKEVQELKDEMDRRAQKGPVGAQRVFGSMLDQMEAEALEAERKERQRAEYEARKAEFRRKQEEEDIFADPMALKPEKPRREVPKESAFDSMGRLRDPILGTTKFEEHSKEDSLSKFIKIRFQFF